MSFVQRHDLWSPAQREAARAMVRRIEADGLEVVRFSFPDQHGILRGKALVAAEAIAVLESGVSITTTLLAKDTAHRTVFPVFSAGGGFGMASKQGMASMQGMAPMQGGGDVLMVADPSTFRVLPWAAKTGWVLCDLYFTDGRPVPFATRHLYRGVIERLAARGYDFVAGLEVECHLFRLVDPRMAPSDAGQPGEPPAVELLSHGYQYLTEQRYDLIEPVLEVFRRDLLALGLPLRSVEVEYGPSQCEFVFAPTVGLAPADLMVELRSAVKQIARRHGLLATFMCRPKIPNAMSSGWHLHQSLRSVRDGANAFASAEGGVLSDLARAYLAGLLAHAREAGLFTTPTINGYKRFRPYSLAPDRAIWARDNRGVMVRVLGAEGNPATRLENRVGEPAANPYLYMASQVVCGLDGIDRALDPGPSADAPYETEAPRLPTAIDEAMVALDASALFRDAFGDGFVDYYLHIKRAELARFQSEVTDWEHREYFEMF